jgi:hypothetical protein
MEEYKGKFSWTYYRYIPLPRKLPGVSKKNQQTLRIIGAVVDVWTGHLQNITAWANMLGEKIGRGPLQIRFHLWHRPQVQKSCQN